MNVFYKICTKEMINELQAKGRLWHPSLQSEGFIHGAYLHQLKKVIQKHYPQTDNLYLVKINPLLLQVEWKSEDLKNRGENFPHVYGEINLSAVEEVVALEKLDLKLKQYPVGDCPLLGAVTHEERNRAINSIRSFPEALKELILPLKGKDFAKTYRAGGWNVKQIIHHCADSHMNSFIRFKLALTEENPIIKPYCEDKWALLPDTNDYDVQTSVSLLDALHKRWSFLLNNMTESDFSKTFLHPESQKQIRLDQNTLIYEWHGKHHLGHIKLALGI